MLELREYDEELRFDTETSYRVEAVAAFERAETPVQALAPSAPAVRNFLFVTAPFGPFSAKLGAVLRQSGATCKRVLLNGGDVREWGLKHGVPFRGAREAWTPWIAEHLVADRVTDLVTHGDSHAYAAEAIEAARALGLNVHVFEQGYFRPHWVTLERDGVNARSALPRTPEHYRQVVSNPASTPPSPVGRITPAAVRRIVAYQVWAYLACPLFPTYRNPYSYAAWRQAAGHVRRYISQRLDRSRRLKAIDRVFDGSSVFLALLQRPGDSQLTRHSRFEQPGEFVRQVVDSFAANAAPEARLLFKSHPLDHGLEPHARLIRQAAEKAGVRDRVFFADDGHFPTLINKAAAVLSVNSTGGLSALEAGLPTIVLGDAIYDIAGLTHQTGLTTFWRQPQQPDPALFSAYRAAVMASCQINGAFSTRHGIDLVVPEAARRLLSEPRQ